MDFLKYYRELARKCGDHAPNADEARRDFQAAIVHQIDGMLYTR